MADDILIRMTKAPPPVALIFVDGVNLRHRYSESFYGMKLEQGQIVSMDQKPDLYYRIADDWNPSEKKKPLSIFMEVPGGVCLIKKPDSKYQNFTLSSFVQAPETGYVSS